jgi:acyl-CoA thioesterase II
LNDEVLSAVSVQRCGTHFVGQSPQWYGPLVFGGILLGQALAAAAEAVPSERRARSLHAYFVGPADASAPLVYEVTPIKNGRSSQTCAVTASQSEHAILTMLCSFATDRDGREYELACPEDVRGPSELATTHGPGPLEFAFVGPTPPRGDGTRDSTHRAWMRIPSALPADPRLHEFLLAFIGDVSYNGACPWDLSGPPDRSRMVSVDHAMWFHRPARADDWLLFDVQSLVHAGGRGAIRGVLYGSDRRVVGSMVQELQFR